MGYARTVIGAEPAPLSVPSIDKVETFIEDFGLLKLVSLIVITDSPLVRYAYGVSAEVSPEGGIVTEEKTFCVPVVAAASLVCVTIQPVRSDGGQGQITRIDIDL